MRKKWIGPTWSSIQLINSNQHRHPHFLVCDLCFFIKLCVINKMLISIPFPKKITFVEMMDVKNVLMDFDK